MRELCAYCDHYKMVKDPRYLKYKQANTPLSQGQEQNFWLRSNSSLG